MARAGRYWPLPFRFRQHTLPAAGGGGGISEDASAPAAVTSTGTSVTTASFTPVANSLIVAISNCGNNTGSSTLTCPVTDSLSSTWTLLKRANGAGGSAEVWAVDAGSSPAARTVTATGTGGANAAGVSLCVKVLTNAAPAASCLGASAAVHGVTAYTISITPTVLNSLICGGLNDNITAGALTVNGVTTAWQTVSDATNTEKYAAFRATSLTSALSSITAGYTNTAANNQAIVAVEILPATGVTRGQKSTLGQIGSGASVATTWSVNPNAGDTILVFVQCATVPTSVVDNGTSPSTFTLDKSTTAGKGAHIYRANNIVLPASGQYSVTVNAVAGSTIQAGGIAYQNVKPGPPTATNVGSATGTAVSSGSAAPANAGGLVFGGFSDASGLNPETITFTGSAPLTEEYRNTNGASFWPMASADALTGSAQILTWTLGDSVAWGSVIAAYDAAGAVVLPPKPPVIVPQAVQSAATW